MYWYTNHKNTLDWSNHKNIFIAAGGIWFYLYNKYYDKFKFSYSQYFCIRYVIKKSLHFIKVALRDIGHIDFEGGVRSFRWNISYIFFTNWCQWKRRTVFLIQFAEHVFYVIYYVTLFPSLGVAFVIKLHLTTAYRLRKVNLGVE